jgi:hypothetical protein
MFWVTRFGTEPPQHQRIKYRWEEGEVIAFGQHTRKNVARYREGCGGKDSEHGELPDQSGG